MSYHSILAIVVGVIGILHIVYAFITPPKAIEPYVNWSSGRLRTVLRIVPEKHRLTATRLCVGALSLVICVTVLSR